MNLKPNLSILSITFGSGGAQKIISLLLKELIKDYNVTLDNFFEIIVMVMNNYDQAIIKGDGII